jgi:hypothetical protein
MMRVLYVTVLLTVASLAADATGAPAAPPQDAPQTFKAGFAERDITPDPGMEQPGGYGKGIGGARHDPCKVRAAVFDDGRSRVALVGLDALGIRADTVKAARKAVHDRCGIEPGAVLIAGSHSHSAGPTVGAVPGEWDGASDLVKSLVYEKSTSADPKYLARVEQAIAEAVAEADERRVEARCAAGFGLEDKVAFNRRFRMKDGRSVTHPGQANPDVVEPAGPTDPQVGVLGAWDKEGKLLGCVVNFACHATTGPGGTSADYIAYIEKAVRGLMGDDAVVVFLPGASGDVTQVDNRSPYAVPQFGERASRFVGGRVGAETLKTLLAIQTSAGPLSPVSASHEVLQIKRRVPAAERVARALELVQKTPGQAGVDPTEWTFAKETVILDALLKRQPVAEVEVQAVQVGPAVFLACPAEYFCQFGLDLKAASKFPFTFPVSLANGCIGYVPTEDALGPGGGGYETRLTSYSNLEPTAGRRMADTLLALAARMTRGPTPQPPPLPPETRGKTWSYGDAAPELE